MKIEVGHSVKFINEDLSGKVKTIVSENKVLVSCSDGFDHEVLVSEIIIINEAIGRIILIFFHKKIKKA